MKGKQMWLVTHEEFLIVSVVYFYVTFTNNEKKWLNLLYLVN